MLNIKCTDGHAIGTPHPTTELAAGDLLTVYGKEAAVARVLDAGD